jgi:hypothetical protein
VTRSDRPGTPFLRNEPNLPEQTFIRDIEILQTNGATIPSRLLEVTMGGIHAVEASVAPTGQKLGETGARIAQIASNEATIPSKVLEVPTGGVEAGEAMMTAQGTIFNFSANY